MTQEEHLLVIYMLARQQQMIKTLASMLKSRGVVSEDDIPAFEFAIQPALSPSLAG